MKIPETKHYFQPRLITLQKLYSATEAITAIGFTSCW